MLDPVKKETYMEIQFAPSWELISDVRRFVSVFYNRTLGEPDAAGRVALATHELLENAAKYSSDGEARLRMEVFREGSPRRLQITISNRSSAEEIERLKQAFASMAAEKDPFAYYQRLIRSSRGRKERAGLGLARVQAEADLVLELRIEGDMAIIQGETQVGVSQVSSNGGQHR